MIEHFQGVELFHEPCLPHKDQQNMHIFFQLAFWFGSKKAAVSNFKSTAIHVFSLITKNADTTNGVMEGVIIKNYLCTDGDFIFFFPPLILFMVFFRISLLASD